MQKDRWVKEYEELQNLPSSSRTGKPSRALKWFVGSNPIFANGDGKRALDLESGKGRNSIYLAEAGYGVVGVEMVESAVVFAERLAAEKGLDPKTDFRIGSVGEKLPFKDGSFDLIIDMMTLHLLDASEREVYSNEVSRLLAKGGHYLFYTIFSDSPAAKDLFKTSPGSEINSYIIPETGMVEKAFSREDISTIFPTLKVVSLEEQTQFTPAFGDVYERVYLRGLLQHS